MSDMSEQEVTAREDVKALARTLNPMLGGIIPLDWSVVEGSEFLAELAKMMLASDWLAAHDEGVRAAERERLAKRWRGLAVWGPNKQGLHILDDVDIESLMDDLWDRRPEPNPRKRALRHLADRHNSDPDRHSQTLD